MKLDLKEYISSGILELYVAGSLSESEMKNVEDMALNYPDVRKELDSIQNSLAAYSAAYKKNPRPEIRQAVLDKIDEIEGYDSNIAPFRMAGLGASTFRYLMAAVIVFLILNAAASLYMLYKWQGTEKQLSSLVEENKNMRNEYEQLRLTLDKRSGDMHMVMNRTNKIVDLKGMEASPSSYATIYWNPSSKKVLLHVENLPKPPKDKQYQLWALKDGKSFDAGVFEMGDDPMHMMDTPIETADAFAVTLEKRGGSRQPTMSPVYVMGKI